MLSELPFSTTALVFSSFSSSSSSFSSFLGLLESLETPLVKSLSSTLLIFTTTSFVSIGLFTMSSSRSSLTSGGLRISSSKPGGVALSTSIRAVADLHVNPNPRRSVASPTCGVHSHFLL